MIDFPGDSNNKVLHLYNRKTEIDHPWKGLPITFFQRIIAFPLL